MYGTASSCGRAANLDEPAGVTLLVGHSEVVKISLNRLAKRLLA
jgi:hypothetical protein